MKKICRKIGPYILEMRNMEERKHKGPNVEYTAALFVNGSFLGSAYNEGNGGCAEVFENEKNSDKIARLEAAAKKALLYTESYIERYFVDPYVKKIAAKKKGSLGEFIDLLAAEYADEVEDSVKREEFLDLHQATSLCFERYGEFRCVRVVKYGYDWHFASERDVGRFSEIIQRYNADGFELINTNYHA